MTTAPPGPAGSRLARVAVTTGVIVAAVAVLTFLLLVVFPALRDLWLPLIYAVAGNSPSAAAVVTLIVFAAPTVVLALMVGLRLKKPARSPLWLRIAIVALVALPAFSLPVSQRRVTDTLAKYYGQVAEHAGSKPMADAVVRGSQWGSGVALLCVAVLLVAAMVAVPRGHRRPAAGRFSLIAGTALVVLWAATAVYVAHQAATVPLDYWWTIRDWPVRRS